MLREEGKKKDLRWKKKKRFEERLETLEIELGKVKMEEKKEEGKEKNRVEEGGRERERETWQKGRIDMENRIGKLERIWKGRDREERRVNIVMKGLKEKGKGIEREVREVLKELGIELGEERMKKMEGGNGRGGWP